MRVALVSEHASPLATVGGVDAGGQNVHVAALATALGKRGAEVVVYTRRDDAGLPAEAPLAPGVTVEHVDAGPPWPVPKDELLPHMDAFARVLRRAWSGDPPDVVHAHFWMSGLAASGAAAGLAPVVQTFHALGVVKRRHQGAADTSPPEREAVEASLARRVQRVVATASEEVFELARMGADPGRVTVVPCGVDLDRFRPDGDVERRTGGSRRRIVVVSRLVERKGVADVIAALARLPGTELVVVGGPDAAGLDADPEARRLRAVAAAAGVADRVDLRGRVGHDRLPALLRSADVVACVPRYEPFGMVALEAMACGVPVVASAVGGLCDSVVHGLTGLHVRPGRPVALAATLRTLLEDRDLARRMGEAGRDRARARYSWDDVARATMAVYADVTRTRRATGTKGAR